jgi:hypothetical protein
MSSDAKNPPVAVNTPFGLQLKRKPASQAHEEERKMKSKRLWMAMVALLASATVAPTMAKDGDDGAKGLFFQQLTHQAAPQNVGIQYWIELHKGGQEVRANNKTVFHSGDGIRFHVTPNINGYAYIVLKSGSQGEHEVLFPVKNLDDDNKVTSGREIVLPTSGELKFDENAGIEKVCLILSRTPIDIESLLNTKPKKDEVPQTIAMVPSGMKDLIPSKVFVAYDFPKAKPIAPVKVAAEPAPPPEPVKPTATSTTKPKLVTKQPVKIASKPAPVKVPTKARPAHQVAPAYQEPPDAAPSSDSGIVTVVYNDPTAVLSADISLQHM